jgi:S-formylglutathione hydrolase
LVLGLRNPHVFKSISALAPIGKPFLFFHFLVHPTQCPWGKKAFQGYLGSVEKGKAYDATELAQTYQGTHRSILIDQGSNDPFLTEQLNPEQFLKATENHPCLSVTYREQSGYDHS